MKYKNVRNEEELKGKVGADWFNNYDHTNILGKIDFCVATKQKEINKELESLLWVEAKTGDFNIVSMFAQLIITIGKERTFDKFLPPAFLGVFDYKKIVFVPYNRIVDIFFVNDFNWNVAPSNHDTKEFKIIKTRIVDILKSDTYQFDYIEDEKELKFFIKNNIASASEGGKMFIDKNNFVPIYLRWLTQVKPFINFDWVAGKKQDIHDSDFFLADLFVDDHGTSTIDDDTPLKEELSVVFKSSHYEIRKENLKSLFDETIEIRDKNKYEQFWKKYKRSPIKDFQGYIIDRRDLLIPQDIRERKGAFFTPQIWVQLSQQYLTDVLGEDWQDEYYIWDCAAGTGNLLAGLTNKDNVFASTIDKADVNVMKDRIANGANLLDDNVFQFDFLNDDFSKLPEKLNKIIFDKKKRKKLVIYINPPYAEASSYGTESIAQVANNTAIFLKYKDTIGAEALNELFAQFFTRIFKEIPGVILASFSTPKYITSDKFERFRNEFQSKYLKGFICRSDTFDNVTGKFPIGFLIWNLSIKESINSISTSCYDTDKSQTEYQLLGNKSFDNSKNTSIGSWRSSFYLPIKNPIAYMIIVGPSMQSNNNTFFTNNPASSYVNKGMVANIEAGNLIEMAIYLTVRHCVETTWINNKDVLISPSNKWEKDELFKSDCLTFMLFSNFNNVTSSEGINHWIPFTEKDLNARSKFESSFMTDFINGKQEKETQLNLFSKKTTKKSPIVFSDEAKSVFNSGRELWKHYHKQFNVNVNASLYDIREYFQGRNSSGKMNIKSEDEKYMELISDLRENIKKLTAKITPKVYDYGFLIK